MGSFSNRATTVSLTNLIGELFKITPRETPLLSMIGGLTGGKSINSWIHTWQTIDNAAASQPAILEGADPTYSGRTKSEVVQATQIHQYGVDVSYTKLAAWAHTAGESILGNQPDKDPLALQMQLKVELAATDVELSMLRGTYSKPADPTATARGMRGAKAAITTNTVAAASAQLSRDHIDELLREMANSGAPFRNPVLFANAFNRQRISKIYGNAPESRTVGGLAINQVITDFTELGVVYNRHMNTDEVFILDLSVCAPVFLAIPGKGHFFMEDKPATGAFIRKALYGEIGWEYGPELWHGSVTGTATS